LRPVLVRTPSASHLERLQRAVDRPQSAVVLFASRSRPGDLLEVLGEFQRGRVHALIIALIADADKRGPLNGKPGTSGYGGRGSGFWPSRGAEHGSPKASDTGDRRSRSA